MFWYGAYINLKSIVSNIQSDLIETMKTVVPSCAYLPNLAQHDGLCQHAALNWSLLILSPAKDGWVGLWGSTPRFHAHVFQKNLHSGITLELEDDKDYRFWSYKVWKRGRIADWFISDPAEYFDSWKKTQYKRC